MSKPPTEAEIQQLEEAAKEGKAYSYRPSVDPQTILSLIESWREMKAAQTEFICSRCHHRQDAPQLEGEPPF